MSEIVARQGALAPHSEDQAILEEAAQEIRELRALIVEVSEHHVRRAMMTHDGSIYACRSCSHTWPCPTARILDLS